MPVLRIIKTSPMKISLILLLAYLLSYPIDTLAQHRYFTRSGHISFFSQAPLENIEAYNKQVVSFIDFNTGEIVFSVPMKAFQFKKSLMQQHFNENFVESDKYPKATFKGKITNIENIDLTKNNTYLVNVEGILSIHGEDKEIQTVGKLEVKGKQIQGKSALSVTPQEFNIKIPSLLHDNIAKRIDIKVDMLYEPYAEKTL
jgi:hypothetical protein